MSHHLLRAYQIIFEFDNFKIYMIYYTMTKSRQIHLRRDPSPSTQETPVVRVQLDRRSKTKEPGFCYTA
ncbi:unnamed protein product [Spirodela intermedia]|uniref:Uncharacterized protein n=2 Tax=Spirodela intermedia TaxID=51605 RepID=A0A7I8LKK5_SPIIN|nr:unnamed protein product [Spirodela intermedia]CAA6673384.1 unnamed protein product [Spirodela intermedia]CAA7410613.1 unnamed protein product [Spirodela intermedia]